METSFFQLLTFHISGGKKGFDVYLKKKAEIHVQKKFHLIFNCINLAKKETKKKQNVVSIFGNQTLKGMCSSQRFIVLFTSLSN